MQDLLVKLGVDWKLLLSQAVNFLLLVGILRYFAYGPIVKMLAERKRRIEEGVMKSEEADKRLGEVNVMAKEKMKEAEGKAMAMIREGEARAKEREAELLEEARKKEMAMMKSAELAVLAKKEEAAREVAKEAAMVVKMAIAKTVEMDPEHIDEALVQKAIRSIAQ